MIFQGFNLTPTQVALKFKLALKIVGNLEGNSS